MNATVLTKPCTALISGCAAFGLVFTGAGAASAAGEVVPFDLHGTVDGSEVTFEWEEIPQTEHYEWTFNVAGTDGVLDSGETFETEISLDVAEMGTGGATVEDYLAMDLVLGFGVSGVFADPQEYYAFEQLRFNLVQLDDGSYTVGPPYSDPLMSEEEAEAHFAEYFTVVQEGEGTEEETSAPDPEPAPTEATSQPTEPSDTSEPTPDETAAEPTSPDDETDAASTPDDAETPAAEPASQDEPLGGFGTPLMIGLVILGALLIGVGVVTALRGRRSQP